MREETFLSPTCSLIKACASSVVVILYISTRRLISVAFINNFSLFLPSLYNDNFLYTDNKKYNMRKVTYEDIFFKIMFCTVLVLLSIYDTIRIAYLSNHKYA